MTTNKKRIAADVPEEFHRLLRVKSVETGRALADVIRECLLEWYGRENLPEDVLNKVEQLIGS